MNEYISISEMAKLHGITRQTLIHYDRINLFKPLKVDDNGYRYYSKHQIPHLREICFLKSTGIKLNEIVEHFKERSPEKEMRLLALQKNYIDQQIAQLIKLRGYLHQKINLYEEACAAPVQLNSPFLRHLQKRQAIFMPFQQPINKENLHLTLMRLWQVLFKHEMIPGKGFGSIIKKEALERQEYLSGAGACIFLPHWNSEIKNTITLAGGDYICMYKYGMPYDEAHLELFMKWLRRHHYELIGDVVDVCLLDTTFYKKHAEVDFCMLQAPIKNN